MPGDVEWTNYAKSLPEIYRDILAAFPLIEPRRQAGDGLAFQTLTIHFMNAKERWSLGEVQAACKQLAKSGFIEIKNEIFAHPTELGERLIAAVADRPVASDLGIPELPQFPVAG